MTIHAKDPLSDAEVEMPFGVFTILRELIRDRIGISYEDDKRCLLAIKLNDRIKALRLQSFLDYYYLLKYGPGSEEEWPNLMDVLSVPETFFWREIDQIHALAKTLIPQVVREGKSKIRIWCAASASGEEPLTIAMVLQEAGWFDKVQVEIVASDVSLAALEKAKSGFYRERSFRSLSGALRSKYFTAVEGGWKVKQFLHDKIKFVHVNLLNFPATKTLATADVIFCRNVFIYFTTRTIESVVNHFAEQMPRPSYLLVGASESLLRMRTPFILQELDGAFVYALPTRDVI